MATGLYPAAGSVKMSFEKEEKQMKEKNEIRITINPVENRKGNLHTFSEMLRKKYEQKEIDFLLSEQEVPFRHEALLDVVKRQPSFFCGKLVSAQV